MKLKALEVPPAQSAFTEAVAVDAGLPPSMTGCDCGGLKTVTFTTAGAAKSSAVIIASVGDRSQKWLGELRHSN